jgi:hypothetical protein
MSMMTFTTFIPTARNDGRRVSRRELRAILRRLQRQFGGYTMSGEEEGEWTDESSGQVYADHTIRVTVACDRGRMREAMDAVLEIGRQLGQKAMWFDVHGADGADILVVE